MPAALLLLGEMKPHEMILGLVSQPGLDGSGEGDLGAALGQTKTSSPISGRAREPVQESWACLLAREVLAADAASLREVTIIGG
jgi:hypothetical protein